MNTEIQNLILSIQSQLKKSHDIKNTQLRLFQMAINTSLLLTSEQRGMLNYYSSLPTSKSTEQDIIECLEKIKKDSEQSNSKKQYFQFNQLFETLDSFPQHFEPLIKKNKDKKYEWVLVLQSEECGESQSRLNECNDPILHSEQEITFLIIDNKKYNNPEQAQDKAQQFIKLLKDNHQQSWIRLGIVYWAQKIKYNSEHKIIEIMKFNQQYYLFISDMIFYSEKDDPDKIQQNKTDLYVSKVQPLIQQNVLHKNWSARGMVHLKNKTCVFYLIYPLHISNSNSNSTSTSTSNCKISLEQFYEELKNI